MKKLYCTGNITHDQVKDGKVTRLPVQLGPKQLLVQPPLPHAAPLLKHEAE